MANICQGDEDSKKKRKKKKEESQPAVLHCLERPRSMAECDYFLSDTMTPPLSLCSTACSAKQNTVRSLPSFVFPATLVHSAFLTRSSSLRFSSCHHHHTHSLAYSLTPTFPPVLPPLFPFWQTDSCPFLCLLCC